MFAEKYNKFVINLLKLLNYNTIENEAGSNNRVLNYVDLVLALLSAIVSYCKLGTVTGIVLLLNLFTLTRMIVNNIKKSKDLRDKYESEHMTRPGMSLKTAPDFIISFQLCASGFALMPLWLHKEITFGYWSKIWVMLIIAFVLMENYLNVQVDLFKASLDVKKL